MKKIATCLLALSTLALAMISCKTTEVLTEQASGSAITVAKGEYLKISLEGNPTTGYTWEVVPGSESILALQGEPNYKVRSNLIGAGGVFTFTFRAVAPGEAPLRLVYHRPWEKGTPPLKEFLMRVAVPSR